MNSYYYSSSTPHDGLLQNMRPPHAACDKSSCCTIKILNVSILKILHVFRVHALRNSHVFLRNHKVYLLQKGWSAHFCPKESLQWNPYVFLQCPHHKRLLPLALAFAFAHGASKNKKTDNTQKLASQPHFFFSKKKTPDLAFLDCSGILICKTIGFCYFFCLIFFSVFFSF